MVNTPEVSYIGLQLIQCIIFFPGNSCSNKMDSNKPIRFINTAAVKKDQSATASPSSVNDSATIKYCDDHSEQARLV